jgi:tetratricopeptide (TPR) repeat protein
VQKKILFLSISLSTFCLFAQTENPANTITQLFKDGRYQDVIVQVQEYVKNNPGSENIKIFKLYMGIAYVKTMKYDMAIKVFEEHNADYPDFSKNEQVKYLIGKLYYDKGEYEKARVMLNIQLQEYPSGEYGPKASELLNSIDEKIKKAPPPVQKKTNIQPSPKKLSPEKPVPEKSAPKKPGPEKSIGPAGSKNWALNIEAGAGNILGLSFARQNLIKSLDAGIGTGFDVSEETAGTEKVSLFMMNFNAFGLYRFYENNNFIIAGRLQLGYNILQAGSFPTGAMDITPAVLGGYMNFYAIISGVLLLTNETAFIPQIGIGYRFQF